MQWGYLKPSSISMNIGIWPWFNMQVRFLAHHSRVTCAFTLARKHKKRWIKVSKDVFTIQKPSSNVSEIFLRVCEAQSYYVFFSLMLSAEILGNAKCWKIICITMPTTLSLGGWSVLSYRSYSYLIYLCSIQSCYMVRAKDQLGSRWVVEVNLKKSITVYCWHLV